MGGPGPPPFPLRGGLFGIGAPGDHPSVDILVLPSPPQCQLVTLLDDNSLHLWSLKAKGGVSELQEDESFTLRGPPG